VKDKRSVGLSAFSFVCKFCAMLLVRMKNLGYRFKLAYKLADLGAFDNVFVEYSIVGNSRKKHIFLQFKTKLRQEITKSHLLSEKGEFSLHKYYESYINVKKNFDSGEEGDEMDGTTDESLFIIYTNAAVEKKLQPKRVPDIGEEEFLMTGGSVLQFNEEKHKDIYEHLKKLPKHREFLSRFRIFYSQARGKEMEGHIKPGLQKNLKLSDSEMEFACMCLIEFVKNWWLDFNYFLKHINSRQHDLLEKTKEKVRTAFVVNMLDQRKTELDDLNIKYEESATTHMEQIERHKALLIFAPGSSTTLTTAKIHQILTATKHIIVNSKQLIRYKTEVMLAWKSMFDVLVLESDSSAEVSPDLFNELSGFLNDNVAEKKFIFISNNVGNTQQIEELRNTLHANLTEMKDVCKFTDIVTESQMFFLDKTVSFQGFEVKLSTIVKNDDVCLQNALDCDSISLLLENEKPSIDILTEGTVKYYIFEVRHSRCVIKIS